MYCFIFDEYQRILFCHYITLEDHFVVVRTVDRRNAFNDLWCSFVPNEHHECHLQALPCRDRRKKLSVFHKQTYKKIASVHRVIKLTVLISNTKNKMKPQIGKCSPIRISSNVCNANMVHDYISICFKQKLGVEDGEVSSGEFSSSSCTRSWRGFTC